MHKSHLDTDVAVFVNKINDSGAKPLYELTPKEAREVLLNIQKEEMPPEADVSEISVALGNGRNMRVILVKPLKINETLPVIYYIHGGGWVMGNEQTHDRLIRQLAADVNAAVVFPVYEASPEAQYPQTTNDLFFVLQYISENGAKYNLDTERLIVAGDSVGGNMATVMALMAKAQNNMPKINFQLLLYPVTDAVFDTPSYQMFADGPWLTRKAMQWFWQQYAPDEQLRREIYASPLQASVEDLNGLPPALIITDENDVLRDEGEAYARKLNQAGVRAVSIRINATIHDFMMLNDLAQSLPTQTTLCLIVEALRSQFAKPVV